MHMTDFCDGISKVSIGDDSCLRETEAAKRMSFNLAKYFAVPLTLVRIFTLPLRESVTKMFLSQ